MTKRQSFWFICLLGATIVALALLASGLSQLALGPGRPFPLSSVLATGGLTPAGSDTTTDAPPTLLVLFVWGAFAAVALGLVLSRSMRRKAWQVFLTALIWLVFLSLLLRLVRMFVQPKPSQGAVSPAPPPETPEALPAVPPFITNPPDWVVIAVSFVVAVIVVGTLWLLWPRRQPKPQPLKRLADVAQDALTVLQTGGALNDTIMRCYAEMCQVIAQHGGIAREQAVTPREFEQQLSAAGVRDEHIHQLTRLFERVRYGAARPGAGEEQEAIACLQAIAQAYGRAS